MYKGETKHKGDQATSLASLAVEAGIGPDRINEMVKTSGKEGAKTICKSILRARRCHIPSAEERVMFVLRKYGMDALSKIFPPVRDPRMYTEQIRSGIKVHLYSAICKMNGWSWVVGEHIVTDSDGQAVSERVELGAIIALDGRSEMGMLICPNARATFDIVNPKKWRPSEEDIETPPPFGWRIGMFEGDPENKLEITPIMMIAAALNQKVRLIKDLVDCTLVRAASAKGEGWQTLGAFPEVGAPDLSEVEDPAVRGMLTIGLSRDGFYGTGAEASPYVPTTPPLDLLDRILEL